MSAEASQHFLSDGAGGDLGRSRSLRQEVGHRQICLPYLESRGTVEEQAEMIGKTFVIVILYCYICFTVCKCANINELKHLLSLDFFIKSIL